MSRVQWRANGESMFGWRKRIGYIAPTVMEVVPYEFYRFAPDGIGLVGVTCNIDDWRPDYFEKALAQVAAAATYLGSRGVDFIIHGGGPLVVARGKGYEEMIVTRHRGRRQGHGDHSRARRHGGAAPCRRAPHRDRLALSQAAQRCADRPSDRQWLRGRPRRGHGSAVQGDAEPAACRYPGIRRQRAGARRKTATRSTCPARNGRRRRSSRSWSRTAASRWSPIRTPASSSRSRTLGMNDAIRGHGRLLASLAEIRHDATMRSRSRRVLIARGTRPRHACNGAGPIGRGLLSRQDHRDPDRRRGRRRLRSRRAHAWPTTWAGTSPAIPASSSATCRARRR